MARVLSDAGEQLAWLGEAIGDDVETLDIPPSPACITCDGSGRTGTRRCIACGGRGHPPEVLLYTRDGVTWELPAPRRVEG